MKVLVETSPEFDNAVKKNGADFGRDVTTETWLKEVLDEKAEFLLESAFIMGHFPGHAKDFDKHIRVSEVES